MDIRPLRVTQERLRKPDQLEKMIDHVRQGGDWTRDTLTRFSRSLPSGKPRKTSLIIITRFEDGERYVHDGHHRVVATLKAGRDRLLDGEVKEREFTYAQYMEVNFSAGWITPFDPRTEVRLPDFGPFKQAVKRLAPDEVMEYVRGNRHLYCKPRKILTVEELAEKG